MGVIKLQKWGSKLPKIKEKLAVKSDKKQTPREALKGKPNFLRAGAAGCSFPLGSSRGWDRARPCSGTFFYFIHYLWWVFCYFVFITVSNGQIHHIPSLCFALCEMEPCRCRVESVAEWGKADNFQISTQRGNHTKVLAHNQPEIAARQFSSPDSFSHSSGHRSHDEATLAHPRCGQHCSLEELSSFSSYSLKYFILLWALGSWGSPDKTNPPFH